MPEGRRCTSVRRDTINRARKRPLSATTQLPGSAIPSPRCVMETAGTRPPLPPLRPRSRAGRRRNCVEGYGACGTQIEGSISELRQPVKCIPPRRLILCICSGLELRHESNTAMPWLTRDADDRKDESRLAHRSTTSQQWHSIQFTLGGLTRRAAGLHEPAGARAVRS